MIGNVLTGRTRLFIHLTGWLLLAFLFYYLIGELRGPQEALLRTGLNIGCMVAIFYGNARLLVNLYLEKGHYRWFIGWTVLLWLGMAGVRTGLEMLLFRQSVLGQETAWTRVFFVSAGSFFLTICFSTLYQLVENRQQLELRHRTLEARHSQAQLDYLKAQINPHFLFNTLHNIYAAATLQHPRTPDMVLRLSELLRYVTYEARAMRVPLQKEIEHVQGYIDLFQMKSSAPLPIEFRIEGDLRGRLIEPMLLLPLVENALKHGDLEIRPQSFLRIYLQNAPHRLLLTVQNTFDPEDRQKDKNGGMGLANVRHRLDLNYPQKYRLETRPSGNVFFALLEIP